MLLSALPNLLLRFLSLILLQAGLLPCWPLNMPTYSLCGVLSSVKPSSKMCSLHSVHGLLAQFLQVFFCPSPLKWCTTPIPLLSPSPLLYLPPYHSLPFLLSGCRLWALWEQSFCLSALLHPQHLGQRLPLSKHTIHVWVSRWTNSVPESSLAEKKILWFYCPRWARKSRVAAWSQVLKSMSFSHRKRVFKRISRI